MRAGFSVKRIKDICDKGSSNVAQKDLENRNGDFPIFGASGFIKNVDFFHQDKEYVGIVKDGSGIGRVSFYPPKSSLIGTLQYIFPKTEYDIRYVGYCLQSLNLSSYRQGAAIPHIYFRDYGEREVLVAENIKEQRRIVKVLDQEFAKIDALKANAEKSLQAAQALFQATLKMELEPKEGWNTISIGSVANLITKGASPKWQGNQYVSSGGIMFITSENVREGFLDISSPKYVDAGFNKKQARSILKKDDVLVNIVGASIGRAAVFTLDEKDANINQAVALVRLCQDDVLPDYLCCFLNSSMAEKFYASMKKDTARANLSLENISNIEFPCPANILEQQIITEKLLVEQQKCRQIENNCKMTLTLCDDLKQALLRKAFNGEL